MSDLLRVNHDKMKLGYEEWLYVMQDAGLLQRVEPDYEAASRALVRAYDAASQALLRGSVDQFNLDEWARMVVDAALGGNDDE